MPPKPKDTLPSVLPFPHLSSFVPITEFSHQQRPLHFSSTHNRWLVLFSTLPPSFSLFSFDLVPENQRSIGFESNFSRNSALRLTVILTSGSWRSHIACGLLPMEKTQEKAKYNLVRTMEDYQVGMYDKPLPCFGCGKGWFSFLVGFVFPPLWYYATVLYFGNYYRKDPRERAGLAASAIAAMVFTFFLLIVLLIALF